MTGSSRLGAAIASIRPPSAAHATAAHQRQQQLTKPTGSLGRLELLAEKIAGMQRSDRPSIDRGVVAVFAADHGVAAQGVSAYPQDVTAQMVANFASGGAAVNVLAGALGFDVRIVDVGVASGTRAHRSVVQARLGPGTADMTQGPAMSRDQALESIHVGLDQAENAATADILIVGEMGIGNTTAAAAIGAAMLDQPAEDMVGTGTGVDAAGLSRKTRAVEAALLVNQPDPSDPLDVLAKVGGFEIGAACGALIGAAAQGLPVILDGFIVTAAALLAEWLAPASKAYWIAGHQSAEHAHAALLGALDFEPVLNLGMRLGEGTGALVAASVIQSACRLHNEMATFAEAQVSDRRS